MPISIMIVNMHLKGPALQIVYAWFNSSVSELIFGLLGIAGVSRCHLVVLIGYLFSAIQSEHNATILKSLMCIRYAVKFERAWGVLLKGGRRGNLSSSSGHCQRGRHKSLLFFDVAFQKFNVLVAGKHHTCIHTLMR